MKIFGHAGSFRGAETELAVRPAAKPRKSEDNSLLRANEILQWNAWWARE